MSTPPTFRLSVRMIKLVVRRFALFGLSSTTATAGVLPICISYTCDKQNTYSVSVRLILWSANSINLLCNKTLRVRFSMHGRLIVIPQYFLNKYSIFEFSISPERTLKINHLCLPLVYNNSSVTELGVPAEGLSCNICEYRNSYWSVTVGRRIIYSMPFRLRDISVNGNDLE